MKVLFCDRCGAELWRDPSTRVQILPTQVADEQGRLYVELCEDCSVELRHWVEQMAEVREGRMLSR